MAQMTTRTGRALDHGPADPAAHGVWTALRFVYAVVPLVAGLDKFFNVLVDWEQYLAAPIANLLPFSPGTFMLIVGVIEIVAGLLVLSRGVRSGGYLVAAWLTGIAINLIIAGYYDIAVRDLSMAVGAWALAHLSVPVEATARTATARREPVHP